MNIEAKSVLVLGGYGLVGTAVCRRLVPHRPRKLIIASLRRWESESRVEALREEFPSAQCELVPVWGDMLLRAEWQSSPEGVHPRAAVLAASDTRGRLIADTFDELDGEILESSLLYQLVMGLWGEEPTGPVDVVVDCVNTATAVAYQNVFGAVSRMRVSVGGPEPDSFREQVDHTLASLYIPQLVRHMQILYESLRRAGTQAYVKVGTSGTGGMGFNIPYTHGEERPSRMLLSKAAIAGSQTMLIWLLARTPDGPRIVKEVKPTAAIAWKEIGYGPIRTGGREIPRYDCPPERAYDMSAPSTLEPHADCGERVAGVLESVALEILGPPRLSKLLFEAHLLKVAYGTIYEAARPSPGEMSGALTRLVRDVPELRQEMISVGIPILLADGEHLLRGPVIKSSSADLGWVDLRPENMARWQARLRKLANEVERQLRADSSSRYDRIYRTARRWQARDSFDIGEVVGWLFVHEEHGRRQKY